MECPFISVVIPVRNGAETLDECLRSLQELDYPQDRMEIILVDGMSTDRTREIGEAHGAVVMPNPRLTVVSARNLGFEKSQGELVAFSDADCAMHRDWLKNCLVYFEDERVAAVGGPNLIPSDESNFAKAVGLVFEYAFHFKGGAPTSVPKKPIESRSHGSNAIYRADALRRVMPIDTDMVEGEDVVMNARITSLGYKLLYVPDVVVFHRRRSTLLKWWRQMRRYGFAKVLMMRKSPKTVTIPQLLLGLAIPLLMILVVAIVVSAIFYPLLAIVLGALASVTVFAVIGISALKARSISVAFLTLIALLLLAFAWSSGFLQELLFSSGTREVNP